jgi:hypothetical protein
MSSPRGLLPRRGEDAELSSGVATWLGARLPVLGEALELLLDLGGERLFALSLVLGKRGG